MLGNNILLPLPLFSLCTTHLVFNTASHLQAERPKASTIFPHLSLPSHHPLEYTVYLVYVLLIFAGFHK